MDPQWWFTYEQCPLAGEWAYKLDSDPIEDGEWHALNSNSSASYRVSDRILQVFSPMAGLTASDVKACLDRLAQAGPISGPIPGSRLSQNGSIETPNVLGISIARHPEGFEMRLHWLPGGREGVVFREIERNELNRAFQELCELIDEQE